MDTRHADGMCMLSDGIDFLIGKGEAFDLSKKEIADELRRIADELHPRFPPPPKKP